LSYAGPQYEPSLYHASGGFPVEARRARAARGGEAGRFFPQKR